MNMATLYADMGWTCIVFTALHDVVFFVPTPIAMSLSRRPNAVQRCKKHSRYFGLSEVVRGEVEQR
jgi:hypothetical protein